MASTYCITFRIADKTVGGKTYADRRQMLMHNARTKGLGFWEETTSFVLTESAMNTWDFADKVCSGLSAANDIVVVFDPSDMSMAYFGPVAAPDVLRSFFVTAQKLP